MTRDKNIRRSRFYVCVEVHGVMLQATLRDDVKGSSVENGPSTVATYLLIDGFIT